MKKQILLTTFLLATNLSVFAKTLPPVPAPRELTEDNSEYVEGTITRLSADDITIFVPYTQNAKSVLTKALADAENMTIEQQVRHLTAVMKSVVKNSGNKSYQTFMRFALNRTLLLVKEFVAQTDWRTPGTPENVLDLQTRGIQLALRFYESDLAYQQRANREEDTVVLNHGEFATMFGNSMLASTQNMMDATAQYRLLYKILEMINWDLSRDQYALDVSDQIVEIYNTLYSMDENPAPADEDNIQNIRRLNILIASANQAEFILTDLKTKRIKERVTRTRNEAEAERIRIKQQADAEQARKLKLEREERRKKYPISLGQEVLINNSSYAPVSGTIHEIREDEVVLKISDTKFGTYDRDRISFKEGCQSEYCVGETIYLDDGYYSARKILALTQFGTFVIEIPGSTSASRWSDSYKVDSFALMKGCSKDVCVGNQIFILNSQKKATVVALTRKGDYVYTINDGDPNKRMSTNRNNLTKIQ